MEDDQFLTVWKTPRNESAPERDSVILLAPGFGSRMDRQAGLALYLAHNGFDVYRYDPLNHVGLSSGEIEQHTMSLAMQSLELATDWLRGHERDQRVGLIANSLSARVAYQCIARLNVDYLVTTIGVVNLRDKLARALGDDYTVYDVDALPPTLLFEKHDIESYAFAKDGHDNDWFPLDATCRLVSESRVPLLAFSVEQDDWIKQDEVKRMLEHYTNAPRALFSLQGSSHDLNNHLVALRRLCQKVTLAAIGMDADSQAVQLGTELDEPSFEDITVRAVQERRTYQKAKKGK